MGVAQNIYKAFEELQTACETIKDLGDCGKCPMGAFCIEDVNMSFGEAVYEIPMEALKEFIKEAERLTDVGCIEGAKQ